MDPQCTLCNGSDVYGSLQTLVNRLIVYMVTVAGADWPAMFLPSVASVGVFLPLNVRLP